jgi:glycosyltransferase involved in cell wall biosynthesis
MLSSLIITYNEERNIERCLLSVKEISDEIIVVDSGSADHTVAIAERLGAKVIHQPFLGYIEQKNFAISQANGDWVLSLDADEALDNTLRQSIAEAMRTPAAEAYSMNRLTNYCGHWVRHCGWYPDTKIRLFKKDAGKWTGVNPHDRYEVFGGKSTLHLKGDILHYSYNTISDHLRQIDHFSSIGAKALYDKGVKSSIAKLIYKPVARFLRAYVVWSGYRDGLTGFIIAVNSAHAVFLKYLRLYYLEKGKSL